MAHAQVFARFPIPLMLGYLYLFNQSHRLKHLYAALLFWVWQWYCGIYLGFLSLMVFVLGFALSFFNKGYSVFKSNSRWYKIGLLCLPLVGLLAVLPLAIPYLQRARQVSMHAYPLVADSIPTLWSYFSSWKGSLFWDVLFGWYTHVPAYWDHMIFPGMMAWGGIAFWMFRALKNPRKSNLFLLLIFLGLFVSVLRLGDYSIYKLWYQVPGFASMKSLGRIINVHLIFFGAGLAYALQTLNQRFPQKRTLMGILCMLFLVLDNYVQPDNIHRREKHLSLQRINKICFELQKYPLAKIFSYEPLHPEGLGADYQLDAMLAAQRTGKTCINGYSATSPGAFTPYWTLPNEANRNYWLKASGVKIPNLIVLH